MYYLIGEKRDTSKFNTSEQKHVYDVSCSRGKIAESLQTLLENDKKDVVNIHYEIIETDGKEFHEEFFRTFSICYEEEAILQTKSISEYIKGKSKEEEEEDHEGIALEIIKTIGAGISPLKDLQDNLYFLTEEFLKDEEMDYRGAHYIAGRLRAFLQTFYTLIDTVIDTLNDAIDLTEKRDGKE